MDQVSHKNFCANPLYGDGFIQF